MCSHIHWNTSTVDHNGCHSMEGGSVHQGCLEVIHWKTTINYCKVEIQESEKISQQSRERNEHQ